MLSCVLASMASTRGRLAGTWLRAILWHANGGNPHGNCEYQHRHTGSILFGAAEFYRQAIAVRVALRSAGPLAVLPTESARSGRAGRSDSASRSARAEPPGPRRWGVFGRKRET